MLNILANSQDNRRPYTTKYYKEYNVCTVAVFDTVSTDNQKISKKRRVHCTRRYWSRVLREELGSSLKLNLEKLRRKRHYWESKRLKDFCKGEINMAKSKLRKARNTEQWKVREDEFGGAKL